jgi:hypothetical protein
VHGQLYITLAFHCSSELYFTWTVKCKEMKHAQRRGGRANLVAETMLKKKRTLSVMLVAVERNPTRAHGGSDGGSGWEAR